MKVYFKGKDGQQYRLVLETESPKMIDALLDQMNIGEVDYINEEDFNVPDTMDIDVMDESGQLKLGTLTCKNLFGYNIKKNKMKRLFYKLFKRYRVLETKLVPYSEGDKMIKETWDKSEPERWVLAKEEDTNRLIGMVYLCRKERIVA